MKEGGRARDPSTVPSVSARLRDLAPRFQPGDLAAFSFSARRPRSCVPSPNVGGGLGWGAIAIRRDWAQGPALRHQPTHRLRYGKMPGPERGRVSSSSSFSVLEALRQRSLGFKTPGGASPTFVNQERCGSSQSFWHAVPLLQPELLTQWDPLGQPLLAVQTEHAPLPPQK
jgi:hypothetical protein